jgi:hypothetical protein
MKTGTLVLLGIWLIASQNVMGANWQIISSPNGTKAVNELHGVSAVSDNDVWAVGASYATERLTALSLIEHWNGTRWSIVPSPNPSSTVNVLNAVAAVSANDVWAVGTAPTGSNTVLIIHWNGTAWSVVPNHNSSMPLSNLAALSVIWAVGTAYQYPKQKSLILRKLP